MKFIRGAANASAGDVPDAELVQRLASAGDGQAFRMLVARYGPILWVVCRRATGDHHLAEDAFQATLLVFARKAGALRAGAAVGGWLHAVAYRVASRVRSTRRAEPAEADPADGPPGGALDELTVREAEAALHEELARLPEKYRAPRAARWPQSFAPHNQKRRRPRRKTRSRCSPAPRRSQSQRRNRHGSRSTSRQRTCGTSSTASQNRR